MKKLLFITTALLICATIIWAAVPSTINDFHLAGTQPNQVTIEGPNRCGNCHGGYDAEVEPYANWQGSMMAQSMRDPLFRAFLTIANQDAPESGDLCLRCHTPEGWLEGRSIPTDGSSLTTRDREGITCDFCHKLVKPTQLGVNPYPNDPDYTANTYSEDQAELANLAEIPPVSGNGMYVVAGGNAKRGPFSDAEARHQMLYSPFHSESDLCGTCHDVSNPAFSRQPDDTYLPNDFDTPPPDYDTYSQFPIERTYSEWLMSDYNSQAGVYAPQFGGNKDYVSTCQDCHMRDVTGAGCNKKGTPIRDDLPMHDLIGGNTFIPGLVAQIYPDEVNQTALAQTAARATAMLQKAATMEVSVTPQGTEQLVNVHIINETGHKLPSGYPEGRRIWINVQAYDGSNTLIYESGAYDLNTGVLTHDADVKIYEIKPGISSALAPALGLEAGPSFHFVLNHEVFKDNRIPARGFTNANYDAIQSPVVGYAYPDGQYWDDTQYLVPGTATRVEVVLYYQTTTKEFVEFLRDENVTDTLGQFMYDLWFNNGKAAPVAMNSATINIDQPIPPVANFAATPVAGNIPLTVNFNDLSANTPTSWLWDFGDGNSSTAQNPSHVYTAEGVYTVSLTATNAYGSDTHTKVDYISATVAQMAYMHVADITVTRSGNKQVRGQATVTVVDQFGAPVSGVLVTGDFSGPTSGTASGTTDANGVVTLSSDRTRNPVGVWCFTVTDISLAGATYDPAANVETTDCESGAAASYATLEQNYPNPFNPTTDISFTLTKEARVKVEVFNITGRLVTRLADGMYSIGTHTVTWDASNNASGVYYYRLQTDDQTITKPMTLLK